MAYFYSSAVVFGLEGKLFYWELASLIDVMLLGHWIEMKSVMGAYPRDVVSILSLANATYRKMIQNLVWATGYNAVAIPLAAGIFYTYGILLSPALGAILMSMSTVIVAINAKMFNKYDS